MNKADEKQQAGGLRQPAVLAWLRLARSYQQIDGESARHFAAVELAGSGRLSTGQFDVLAQVGAREGLSQQELADALLVTKGNVSQLLARLERTGLVERRIDGRRNCLWLTQQGRVLYEQLVPAQEALIASLFGMLSVDEQLQLLGLLRKLDRGLSDRRQVAGNRLSEPVA
jgi:DNA-binding MarR family transcriptional regulator